jgi:hypothetical protein
MTYEQVVKQPGWGDALTFAAAIEPMAIAEHLILHTDKHRVAGRIGQAVGE